MSVLFLPKTGHFTGSPAAGSGTVTQWTYTVPAGKRAEVHHAYVQVNGNANAANTTQALIQATIAGTGVRLVLYNGSGVAATDSRQFSGQIVDLSAGDTVTGLSVNTGAAAVAMLIDAVIREYQ